MLAGNSSLMSNLPYRHGESFAGLDIPTVSHPPIPKWDIDADKLLLAGVYKHGYGKFTDILADEELGLGTRMEHWIENSPELKQPTIPVLNKRLFKILEASKKHKVITRNAT